MNKLLSSVIYTMTRSEFMAGLVGLLLLTDRMGHFTVNGGDWTWAAKLVLGAIGFFTFSRAWVAYETNRIHAAYERIDAENPA